MLAKLILVPEHASWRRHARTRRHARPDPHNRWLYRHTLSGNNTRSINIFVIICVICGLSLFLSLLYVNLLALYISSIDLVLVRDGNLGIGFVIDPECGPRQQNDVWHFTWGLNNAGVIVQSTSSSSIIIIITHCQIYHAPVADLLLL